MCARRARQRLRVLGRHGGHDLFVASLGHRPEHALSDGGIGGTDCVGGDAGPRAARTSVADSMSSRLISAASRGSVEVMDRGSGGGQLDRMAALGGQVQIGPCDDVLAGVRGKSPQAKSPQHRTETDLDADQFEAVVRASSEDHVGDPCHPLPH